MEVSEFTDNLVTFLSHRIKQAKTVWLNEKELNELDENYWDYKKFSQTFAYANKNSGCFLHVDFDSDDGKVLEAERYGGIGVGTNGGGVRCGNLGKFQLKGTGINQMLGDHDDLDHSSGNYPLFEAMTEAINSQIYNHILPVGAVKAYGLLFTGTSAHMRDPYAKRQPLALMVRETCLRPAHFLRQPFHKPLNKFRAVNQDDVARVRAVNRALGKKFPSNNAFIMYLGKFLANCANQLAFAKIFRIAHGAFSPSNVALDGRWLDLTNMTMVPTGTNYVAAKGLTPFLSEVLNPLSIVEDLLYTYGKYNHTDLNIAPLTKYYFEQYNSYCFHYVVQLFGIDSNALEIDSAMPERQTLMKSIATFIADDTHPKVGFPHDENRCDPLQPFIESLFLSLVEINKTTDAQALKAFSSLLMLAHQNPKNTNVKFSGVVSAALIKSLRKVYFSPFFFLGSMHTRIKKFIDGIDVTVENNVISNYINSYSNVAAWIFDKKDTQHDIFVFCSSGLSIIYHPTTLFYSLITNNNLSKKTFESPLDLLNEIKEIDPENFTVAGYCFSTGIIGILNMLISINSTPIVSAMEIKANV